jgi:thiamine pyrophosphate-dependent acetolactate synthase large subunit-like protein
MDKLGAGLTDEQALIHLDIDPSVIGRVFKPRLAIIGDARDGLAGLAAALGTAAPAEGWDRGALAAVRRDAGPRWTAAIAELIRTLRRALPDDSIIVNDQTGLTYWAEWRLPVYAPRTFLYPVGSATLGYAVPAAIGAKIARPDAPVIAIAGDGGFMFSVAELATAVKYRLPIVFLVVNDGRYGAIKFLQETMFEGRWGETDLSNPDFPALARAFGARGDRLHSVAALPAAIAAAFAASGPTVLELQAVIAPPWDG